MIDFDQFDYLVEHFRRRSNHPLKTVRLPAARRTFSRFTLPAKNSKTIANKVQAQAEIEKKKYYASMLSAQMEALAAARETANHPLTLKTDETYPNYPRQTYPTVDTYGRKPLIDDIYWPPVEKNPVPVPKQEDPAKVASLNKEIAELRQKLTQLQDSANTTPETPEEFDLRRIRTRIIVTEISHDKNIKERLSPEYINEIQQRVEAKIQLDRDSSDNDVYQRNRDILEHLMRRQKYSKHAYKVLKQVWSQLNVSENLLTFTGRLFDREYLKTKSDKYYKYVSILTFMLKYQRISKVRAKPWFKDTKAQDKDEYFFGKWQRMVTEFDTLA